MQRSNWWKIERTTESSTECPKSTLPSLCPSHRWHRLWWRRTSPESRHAALQRGLLQAVVSKDVANGIVMWNKWKYIVSSNPMIQETCFEKLLQPKPNVPQSWNVEFYCSTSRFLNVLEHCSACACRNAVNIPAPINSMAAAYPRMTSYACDLMTTTV